MKEEKSNKQNPEKPKVPETQASVKRRTLLKSMFGLPVLGVFAFETFRKWEFDQQKKNIVIDELGLQNLNAPVTVNNESAFKGDLLSI